MGSNSSIFGVGVRKRQLQGRMEQGLGPGASCLKGDVHCTHRTAACPQAHAGSSILVVLSTHQVQTLFRGLCRCACTDPQGATAPLFGNVHVMKRRSQPLAFRTGWPALLSRVLVANNKPKGRAAGIFPVSLVGPVLLWKGFVGCSEGCDVGERAGAGTDKLQGRAGSKLAFCMDKTWRMT